MCIRDRCWRATLSLYGRTISPCVALFGALLTRRPGRPGTCPISRNSLRTCAMSLGLQMLWQTFSADHPTLPTNAASAEDHLNLSDSVASPAVSAVSLGEDIVGVEQLMAAQRQVPEEMDSYFRSSSEISSLLRPAWMNLPSGRLLCDSSVNPLRPVVPESGPRSVGRCPQSDSSWWQCFAPRPSATLCLEGNGFPSQGFLPLLRSLPAFQGDQAYQGPVGAVAHARPPLRCPLLGPRGAPP